METKHTITKSSPDIFQISGRYFPGSVITLMGDDGHPIGAVQVSTCVELVATFKVIPFNPKK